jgi:ribonuclease HI
VLNPDLWQRLDELNQKYSISWRWVPGHAGISYNEQVDRLAVAAIPK